jgi:hypothetical protein
MIRTTILLPGELKTRAERHARAHGTSLGQLIRQALEITLREADKPDALFSDDEPFDGDAPADLASEHDRYLYGRKS